MLSIALTGGIGSGKSSVGEIFDELGAIVIDSDQLSRDVIERGTPGFDEVVARFGDVILVDGEISRSKLAEIVFVDEKARKDLESIIHPRVREIAERVVARAPEDAIVINEIPLLFETQGQGRFDLVITVEASDESRTKRLIDRGLKSYQIEKRISAQASRAERESISDYVIENDEGLEELERKVRMLWEDEILPRSGKSKMTRALTKTPRADKPFKVISEFKPAGDQPSAISDLENRVNSGERDVVLLGATGTGKSATIAWLIEKVQRPTLIIAPNKTLAAQLANEFRELMPENAIEYFVSYYDYYQPEAYVPQTDTFIEKDASINSEVERLRYSATYSLLTRRDVVVVATVSCIYGLGTPQEYIDRMIHIHVGDTIDRNSLLRKFVEVQYKRNDIAFERGTFRVRGDTIEIIPVYEELAIRIEMFGDEIERLTTLNPLTGEIINEANEVFIFPATHYSASPETMKRAISQIESELGTRLQELERQNKLLEAQRLRMRTQFDLEMISQLGFCSGIENYSRHIDGRDVGSPPNCLLDYFPEDFLCVIDESHITVPQIGAMQEGDASRKRTLVEHGFRLPSALDNRPLTFTEFLERTPQKIYLSATPGPYELEQTKGIYVEQVIRPTGLVDPKIVLKPTKNQIDDLMGEIKIRADRNERILVTTLTKKMAEDLTDYFTNAGIRVRYLHSEVDTLRRVELLRELRLGEYDVLIGINLLREGLDLPEVSLVAILDADKEGFLRSTRSLIQTIGRAARNVSGEVHMYGDNLTDSMKNAIDETNRRRAKQESYNKEHGIDPAPLRKKIADITDLIEKESEDTAKLIPTGKRGASETPVGVHAKSLVALPRAELLGLIDSLTEQMRNAAAELQFELAARLRDEIRELKRELRSMDEGGVK